MTPWLFVLLAGALFAALEWRRPRRRHRGVRVAALVVAGAALAALAAPPLIPGRGAAQTTAILVTPGTTDSLRALARKAAPAAPVLVYPDSVSGLAALRLRLPELRHLHVTGWGLRESEWAGQEALEIHHYPAPAPPGFDLLIRPRVIRLGETATLAARIHGGLGSPTIWLAHPDGTIDSAAVGADSAALIRFTARPRATGQFPYVLEGVGLPAETVSVAVLPPRPPAVLIVEGVPSFESTFLRRWLASQGGAVATRTRLSRDRDRTERINLPEMSLERLTPALLDRFDLLVIDGFSLASLDPGERVALDQAMRQRGLGMLIAPDSAARQLPDRFPFQLEPTGDVESRQVRILWPGGVLGPETPVPVLPAEIRQAAGVHALARDPVGRILAASRAAGQGTVGTTLVNAPSRWLLEEESDAYAHYWRRLFAALARNRNDRWMPAPEGPIVVDHGLTLALMTGDTLPFATITRPSGVRDTLGLARDPAEPLRWWGRYWPVEPGWHDATNREGEPYPFYVGLPRESAEEATARLVATGRWMTRARGTDSADSFDAPRQPHPLSPLIPFLALVLATGVLWGVERRGKK